MKDTRRSMAPQCVVTACDSTDRLSLLMGAGETSLLTLKSMEGYFPAIDTLAAAALHPTRICVPARCKDAVATFFDNCNPDDMFSETGSTTSRCSTSSLLFSASSSSIVLPSADEQQIAKEGWGDENGDRIFSDQLDKEYVLIVCKTMHYMVFFFLYSRLMLTSLLL